MCAVDAALVTRIKDWRAPSDYLLYMHDMRFTTIK